MVPGTKIAIDERLIGLVVDSDGVRYIHTIERGAVLTIEKVIEGEGLIEVRCNRLHLLVSRENLENRGHLSAVSG